MPSRRIPALAGGAGVATLVAFTLAPGAAAEQAGAAASCSPVSNIEAILDEIGRASCRERV